MSSPEDAASERIDGTHQLAAVMFTDVVGFSSQTHANEAETLKAVARDMRRIGEVVDKHNGRLLKTMGDGVLAHFMSATDAVRCGIEFQTAMQKGFGPDREKSPLQHRVGIHLGDMYVSESEVMGDGVNIASRLQTIAEPGGICVSQTVYDIIKNKVALKATSLGPQELKNISHAVNVYKIIIGAIEEEIKVETDDPPRQGWISSLPWKTWQTNCSGEAQKWMERSRSRSQTSWLWLKNFVKTKRGQWIAGGCACLFVVILLGLTVAPWEGEAPPLTKLTNSEVETALAGRTVNQGSFLFVPTKGEILRKNIIALTHLQTEWSPSAEVYRSTYRFVLRVRAGRETYHAVISHDGNRNIKKVEISDEEK